jgi:hypothetical protein
MLDFKRSRVRHWTDEYGLEFVRGRNVNRSPIYVSRLELRRFARRKPHCFAGASRENLYMLLEDEDLADYISEHHKKPNKGCWQKVKCIETGQIFASITEAAKLNRCCFSAVLPRSNHSTATTSLMALVIAAFVAIPAPINGASGNSTKSRSPIFASSKNS